MSSQQRYESGLKRAQRFQSEADKPTAPTTQASRINRVNFRRNMAGVSVRLRARDCKNAMGWREKPDREKAKQFEQQAGDR